EIPVDAGIVRIKDEVSATIVNKPKGTRKKSSALPPKRLKEDYSTSGDAGARTAGKSLITLQDLLDSSTLAAKVGATAAVTVP
ncbi:hypothetical protein Tco_0619117, partial [Tanacetum coccineum]